MVLVERRAAIVIEQEMVLNERQRGLNTSEDLREKLHSLPLPRFATFYSTGHGVGRSSAVYNMAALLAATGERTLLIDLDVERPGFSQTLAPNSKWGVLDLFNELLEKPRSLTAQTLQNDLIQKRLAEEGHLSHHPLSEQLASLNQDGVSSFDFLPASSSDNYSYLHQLCRFQEKQARDIFGKNMFNLAVRLKATLSGNYDYVLVNSPSGFSQLSLFALVSLGNTDVLLTSLGEQHRSGLQIVLEKLSLTYFFMRIIPVISPVPDGDLEAAKAEQDIKGLIDKAIPHFDKSDRLPLELHFNPHLLYKLPIISDVSPGSYLDRDYLELLQAIRGRINPREQYELRLLPKNVPQKQDSLPFP